MIISHAFGDKLMERSCVSKGEYSCVAPLTFILSAVITYYPLILSYPQPP